MHLLSARNRSEFLAVPILVRFTVAKQENGWEPTLLIKATTLKIKYLLRRKVFRLVAIRVFNNCLAYGIRIDDDPKHPEVIWSVLAYEDEMQAMRALITQPRCVVFLFNEITINVAWCEVDIDLSLEPVRTLVDNTALGPTPDRVDSSEITNKIDEMDRKLLPPNEACVLDLPQVAIWHPVQSHYVSNSALRSSVSVFDPDEGGQQEEIALWLIDNLQPTGAFKNPEVHETDNPRELCDLLLSYERGAFLFESKTLSILARSILPSREKLSQDIVKHLRKATNQLKGGIKNLRRGLRVTDSEKRDIHIERTEPPHIIVIVPELDLLSAAHDFGGEFVRRIHGELGSFFHILDLCELLRMVQAAEMISRQGVITTPMMAFDYYLIERAKRAVTVETPNFSMLLRFEEDSNTNEYQ